LRPPGFVGNLTSTCPDAGHHDPRPHSVLSRLIVRS
jgi:hypothetical protein